MSIPFHQLRDNPGEIDLLVPANPVWETSWLLDELPAGRFNPNPSLTHVRDGGGSALNSACALAAVGRRVVAVGHVGDDQEGQSAIEALKRRGVEPRISKIAGQATVRTDLFVERATRSTAFRANVPETRDAKPRDEIEGLGAATFLLLDHLRDRTFDWFRSRSAKAGLLNVLNINEPSSTARASKRLEQVLPFLDVLQIPEATGPIETSRPVDPTTIHRPRPHPGLSDQEVSKILTAGVSVLIRTRGAEGIVLQTSGVPELVVPARKTEVQDPTGAGDALTAGLLDALLSGGTLAEAADHGIDWAARAVRHLGARGWLDREPPEPFACGEQNR